MSTVIGVDKDTITVATAQRLWAAVGWYNKGIDGIVGSGSVAAMDAAETEYGHAYEIGPGVLPQWRKVQVAAQAALLKLGYEPGTLDGLWGGLSAEALALWEHKATYGTDETLNREPVGYETISGLDVPMQADVAEFYGKPGTTDMERSIVTITLPFPFRIDWDLEAHTDKIRVHRKCSASLKAALIEVRDHYGVDEWHRLGLDRYAGAYNPRRMRGGKAWSMHAYGCAIDFYAQPNGLRTRAPLALFSQPVYEDFINIMEAHGWLSAGRMWGADWMHFQAARL